MQMLRTVILVVITAVTVSASGKEPWKWTLEERMQARFSASEKLDGNVHPERFLPSELFETLVRSSFLSLPATYPRHVRAHSDGVLTTDADWHLFTDVTRAYVNVLAEERDLIRQRVSVGREQVRAEKCRVAFAALRKARAAFGPETFDRFLYTVVAPGMSQGPPNKDASVRQKAMANLKKREAGCH